MSENNDLSIRSDTTADRGPIRELRAAMPAEVRRVRVEVLAETLANGVPVDPAALTIILATHLDNVEVPWAFTRDHVTELLWFEVTGFCDDHGIATPTGCAQALHALLATLLRTARLVSDASDIAGLFAPFDELGSLAATG